MSKIDNTDKTTPEFFIPINALDDIKTRKQLSPSGFRLFTGFCNCWGFNKNQRLALLDDVHPQTYRKWERISLLLGIHKDLKILFADHDSARRWFFSVSHDVPFGGISPFDYLFQGNKNNLYGDLSYLDAWIEMK